MALIYEAFYYKVFKLEFKIILSWAMKCRNGKQNFSLRRYYCEKVVKNIPRLEIMIIFFSNVNFLARLEVESYFRFSLRRYLVFLFRSKYIFCWFELYKFREAKQFYRFNVRSLFSSSILKHCPSVTNLLAFFIFKAEIIKKHSYYWPLKFMESWNSTCIF